MLTEFRLLEMDNRLVLPFFIESQVSIPRLGIKADANPGVFYGQCSEICGAYPRFMPISLEFVSNNSKLSDYLFYDSDSGYERGGRDCDRTDSD